MSDIQLNDATSTRAPAPATIARWITCSVDGPIAGAFRATTWSLTALGRGQDYRGYWSAYAAASAVETVLYHVAGRVNTLGDRAF